MKNELSLPGILEWADGFYRRTGKWPTPRSGAIPEAPGEDWASVAGALSRGRRGVGPISLAAMLVKHRGIRRPGHMKKLTDEIILTFVLDHLARTGSWPTADSGRIPRSGGETWSEINQALRRGRRGLVGNRTICKFLESRFGGGAGGSFKAGAHRIQLPYRGGNRHPALTEEQIIHWARRHQKRTGHWPTKNSGSIPESPWQEKWSLIDYDLLQGHRGLGPGSSLRRVLAKHGLIQYSRPPLTEEKILQWAREHRQRTGKWPISTDRDIPESGGEKWGAVWAALVRGGRGLPGGSSVYQLLISHGIKKEYRPYRRLLSLDEIQEWMRRHRKRTGRWPRNDSGPIPRSGGESWSKVAAALNLGVRGLEKGHTLRSLVREFDSPGASEKMGRDRSRLYKPALSLDQIQEWMRRFHKRTGRWPRKSDGPISSSNSETWAKVLGALNTGTRGLEKGHTLRSLAREFDSSGAPEKPGRVRSRLNKPALSFDQIQEWMRRFRKRTGRWPRISDGPISESNGETWAKVVGALNSGARGLEKGHTLRRLGWAMEQAE